MFENVYGRTDAQTSDRPVYYKLTMSLRLRLAKKGKKGGAVGRMRDCADALLRNRGKKRV